MSKYIVETFYTCTFKIIHKLDELNEKKLSELENSNDGVVKIIDVKLNNRKTKTANKNQKIDEPTSNLNEKNISGIASIVNEKIVNSDKLQTSSKSESENIKISKFHNKKTNDRSKMPDRRKGYIQKVSIGDHKIYLHTGGGGKGMKLVKNEKELGSALSLAKQEAKKYFSNDEVYIEKYFEKPRHIEVQILSDKKTTIHMGERDCSVQRKHQKLIEESPSPVLEEKTRKNLLNKTVEMVSKLNYEGAGTVEFMYDNGKFFFLEMNTRIQVEHPVSEIRGGIDIVKEQIKIASKGKTSLKQSDINFRGHVIECRINAEDPRKNFQPSPGTISVCHQPSGFRTRVDGAIFQGCKITPYYDSLICKLICQGRDREEAIQRILRSLNEFVIEGITTTIDLHKKILSHKKFISSDFDVNWLVKENFY